MNHARVVIIPLFLLALGGAYQRAIAPVGPAVTTEEGQSVVFVRFTWQYR